MKILKTKLTPHSVQDISSDHWYYQGPEYLISSWEPVQSQMQVANVISVFCLKQGWQISKKHDKTDQLRYWYCDIIDSSFDKDSNTLSICDLILDWVLFPDGQVQVLDIPEFHNYQAQSKNEATALSQAPEKLNQLMLQWIQSKSLFPSEVQKIINKIPAVKAHLQEFY